MFAHGTKLAQNLLPERSKSKQREGSGCGTRKQSRTCRAAAARRQMSLLHPSKTRARLHVNVENHADANLQMPKHKLAAAAAMHARRVDAAGARPPAYGK
jgi:hypothetical protein